MRRDVRVLNYKIEGVKVTEHTYSHFIYFDTNIISTAAQKPDLWIDIQTKFMEQDLTMALGSGQISELSDAQHLHADIVQFLLNIPSGIIKNFYEVVEEEFGTFPESRIESLLKYPLNAIVYENGGVEKLLNVFSSDELLEERRSQKLHSKRMASRHSKLKGNFSASKSGKYETHQADEFADLLTIQFLANMYPSIIQSNQVSDLTTFKSIRLFALVIFYKYYIGKRNPKKLSDFGDLFHLYALPYCEVVVLERDLTEILRQIQRNHSVMDSVFIKNIEYLDSFRA